MYAIALVLFAATAAVLLPNPGSPETRVSGAPAFSKKEPGLLSSDKWALLKPWSWGDGNPCDPPASATLSLSSNSFA